MTAPSTTSHWQSPAFATQVINSSAKFWFSIVLVGQAVFSYYIVAFYYTATFSADPEQFNQILAAGYIEGDFWGNLAVIGHVLFAAIITIGGLLQLIPIIRSKIPALHRWNGRLYILVAVIMSLSGAYMIIARNGQVVGNWFGHSTLMINGAIILLCAFKAFKYARMRTFVKHREWALRMFVAVSGVWLFRVGMMAWLSFHGKPVGFDPVSFSGPFLTVLYILVYIMPLLFLEVYLRAHARGSVNQKLAAASGVLLLSLVIAFGVFGATMGMWLPRI